MSIHMVNGHKHRTQRRCLADEFCRDMEVLDRDAIGVILEGWSLFNTAEKAEVTSLILGVFEQETIAGLLSG